MYVRYYSRKDQVPLETPSPRGEAVQLVKLRGNCFSAKLLYCQEAATTKECAALGNFS